MLIFVKLLIWWLENPVFLAEINKFFSKVLPAFTNCCSILIISLTLTLIFFYSFFAIKSCLINFSSEDPQEIVKEVKSSEPEFNRNLLKRVEELELSVRSMNCLKNDNIIYIGDLVQKSEGEMLRTPNFGRKSLNEIKEVLTGMSLYLGMEIPNWPPDNIAEMSKKLEETI